MKAVINNVPYFDKSDGITGTFEVDAQIFGHEIIIKNSTNTTTVYSSSEIIISGASRFTIPPDVLTNGNNYILYIKTYENSTFTTSYTSDGKVISCITTPSFELDKYTGSTYELTATTLNLSITYSQAQSVALDNFYIAAKDSANKIIYTSKMMYNASDSVDIDGLENEETYKIKAYGTVNGGMSIVSSELEVFTNFVENTSPHALEVTNNADDACNDVVSGMNVIKYTSNSTLTYSDNTYVNLENNKLSYSDGLLLSGDFSCSFKVTCSQDCKIFETDSIKLNYRFNKVTSGNTTTYNPYFEFIVGDYFEVIKMPSVAESGDSITATTYKIAFNRINGLYTIAIT